MYKSGLGVNFCLVRNGEVLLQQRDENCPHYPLQWCFPGGAQDDTDIEPIDVLIREVKEEYGISLDLTDCEFLTNRPLNNPGQVFICRVPDNQEPVLNEGKDMKWVPIIELNDHTLGFNQQEFITPALIKWHEKEKYEQTQEFQPKFR